MGSINPSKEHRPSELRKSDYLLEGKFLVAGGVCRWGAERKKARMSGSLRDRIMLCRHSYPGRYEESQTEDESDKDDRWVTVSSLLSRSCGNYLSGNLCSRRSFFL
jgi:hypothetical protein